MSDRPRPDGVRVFTTPFAAPAYPWLFEVTHRGQTYSFAGAPNKCATRRQAAARAGWRLRWLRRGEFEEHYA